MLHIYNFTNYKIGNKKTAFNSLIKTLETATGKLQKET